MKKMVVFLLTISFCFLCFLTVAPVSAISTPQSTPSLSQFDLISANPYYSTSSQSQLNSFTLSFKTQKTVPNGEFIIAVPVSLSPSLTASQSANFLATRSNEDLGAITCPRSISGQFEFLSPLATPSTTLNSTSFDFYSCPYQGEGNAGTDFSLNPFLLENIINPISYTNSNSNSNSNDFSALIHTHSLYFAQLPTNTSVTSLEFPEDFQSLNYGLVDSAQMSIFLESTSTSFTTSLSLSIDGLPAKSQVCGRQTSVSSQPQLVNFEDLDPYDFRVAGQRFNIRTNASFGYLMTASQNDQLGINGAGCAGADAIGNPVCIADATSNNTITPTKASAWTDPYQSGFGYSLENLYQTTSAVFTTTSTGPVSTSSATNTFPVNNLFRQFADRSNSEDPLSIFRSHQATVTAGDEINVCYQISPTPENTVGSYLNQITYTLTATF